jgi:FkbM family methyltransferase
MDLKAYEKLDPVMTVDSPAGPVYFSTPNLMTAWRVESLFTKEPDTIEWIGEFPRDAVLVDIGANVGMYTIWAAKTRGARVFAFEPESQNFALLNRNIVRNEVGDLVVAYCASLSDTVGFGRLALSGLMYGGSGNQYSTTAKIASKHKLYLQGSYSSTLDTLVEQALIPVPTHIKIDVDGIEPKIVNGARQTFADKRLQSVLIEVDTNRDDHWEMVDLMLELGFDFSQEQVDRAQRTEGPNKGIGNYVFRR